LNLPIIALTITRPQFPHLTRRLQTRALVNHIAPHDKMAAASQKTKATMTKVTLAHHAPYKNAKTSRQALCDKVIAKLPLELREMIYEHIRNTDTEAFRIAGPCKVQ
jgi:hypothetical protein